MGVEGIGIEKVMGCDHPNTWSIGGGKGGTGKSFVASRLASDLAMRGYSVILVDADFTGGGVHAFFRKKYPEKTLGDFLSGRVENLSDILLTTPVQNLTLICGPSNNLDISNLKYAQKQKIIRSMGNLHADYLLIDTGPGWSYNNLDFFNFAKESIILVDPALVSVQFGCVYLKMALQRKILAMLTAGSGVKERVAKAFGKNGGTGSIRGVIEIIKKHDVGSFERIEEIFLRKWCHLVVNKATEDDGERVWKIMSSAAEKFLGLELSYLGRIGHAGKREPAFSFKTPIALCENEEVTASVKKIARGLLREGEGIRKEPVRKYIGKRDAPPPVERERPSHYQLLLNDDVIFEGTKLHVQTEDLGPDKSRILTIVFHGGRVLFSRTTEHRDIQDKDLSGDGVVGAVKWQHRAVIAGIRRGKLRGKILKRR